MNEPSLDAANAGGGPAWRRGLAFLTVALMGLSFNLGYYLFHWLPGPLFKLLPGGLQHHLEAEKPLYFSPLDALLPLLLLVLAWDLFKGRIRDWALPLPNLLWALAALVSFAWVDSGGRGSWFKSALLQTGLVAVCGVWAFRHFMRDLKTARALALVLGASLGVCLLAALYQYAAPVGRPLKPGEHDLALAGGYTNLRVSGWYDYRGQLAAQVAMLVPACVALLALGRDPAARIAAGAAAMVGLCVCLSGGGVIGASAGVLAVAAALWSSRQHLPCGPLQTTPGWKAILIAFGLVAALGVVLPLLPRKNPEALWDSLTLYRKVDTEKGKRAMETARLRRHQAALALLSDRHAWKKGVGAGGFQSAVNVHYDDLAYPKPGANTDDEAAFDQDADEPFSFGLYETTAVELGIGGLLAVVFVYLAWAGAALAAFLKSAEDDARMLALASLGAAAGAAVFSIFGHPLVRGCGGTWAFFMGLALFLNARASEQAANR
ncbi:MAG: hypothetical protein M5U26_15830 [Planctomycetota bacterium]|nr:hypothetical protein [Planctomycetota bacterium]